jgi:hypothetical protein
VRFRVLLLLLFFVDRSFAPLSLFFHSFSLPFFASYFHQFSLTHTSFYPCLHPSSILFYINHLSSSILLTVEIVYYCSDNTLEIIEEKIPNSGMAAGSFLARGHVPNVATGTTFVSTDFAIGSNVEIFSRVFHIYDSDKSTKSTMKFDANTVREEVPSSPFASSLRPQPPKKNNSSSATGGRAAKSTTKWLKIDCGSNSEETEILRFFALWDDPTADKELSQHQNLPQQRYKIHYYLEDESLEILVSNASELNYELNPTLLRRQKATSIQNVNVNTIGASAGGGNAWITPLDFIVGGT